MSDASQKLADWFALAFPGFAYPYGTADDELKKLDLDGKRMYGEEAARILESFLWKNEYRGMLQKYFSHLAFKSNTSEKQYTESDCYRLVLLMLQDFERRLAFLAESAKNPGRNLR